MFGKLLKHEFRASFRTLLPLMGALLIAAVLGRLSIFLMDTVDSVAVNIFGVLFLVLFFLGCIAAVVLTVVFAVIRFVRSVLSDQGYLTHTLPVGVNSIILSRLLVAIMSMLCVIATIVLGVLICFFRLDLFDGIGKVLHELFVSGEYQLGATLLWLLASMLVSLITGILQFYAAMAIGHSFANKKGGFSVLFYFIFYVAEQIISSIAIAVRFGMTLTTNQTPGSEMAIISLCLSVLFGGVFYFLTWLMLKKRLNLA